MSLEGKYLVVWISDAGAQQTLGVDQTQEGAGYWLFGGRVTIETPALGVWVALDDVRRPDGTSYELSGGKSAATLLRWTSITGALLGDAKPKAQLVGFKP